MKKADKYCMGSEKVKLVPFVDEETSNGDIETVMVPLLVYRENVAHHAYYIYRPVTWKEVEPFRGEMVIENPYLLKETGFYLRDTDTGWLFYMSTLDFVNMLQHSTVINGTVSGSWQVTKTETGMYSLTRTGE